MAQVDVIGAKLPVPRGRGGEHAALGRPLSNKGPGYLDAAQHDLQAKSRPLRAEQKLTTRSCPPNSPHGLEDEITGWEPSRAIGS